MFKTLFNKFGTLAAWLGFVDEDAVREALAAPADGKRLGERLEEAGHLNPGQTARVLEAQRLARAYEGAATVPFQADVLYPNADIPLLQLRGVLDGSPGCVQALQAVDLGPRGRITIVSLREVAYVNRMGVKALMDFWSLHPFVLCEVPELFQILLREIGVDRVAPILPTPMEAAAVARVRADQMRADAVPEIAHPPHAPAEEGEALEVSVEMLGETLVVILKGVLGPHTAVQVMKDFSAMFKDVDWPLLVLDLEGLERCSQDGLVVLGALPDSAELLIAAPDAVRHQLTLLGLDQQYALFPDRASAEWAAQAPFVAVEGRDVFHKRGCRGLRSSAPANRRYLHEEDVSALRPCRICLGRPDQCDACSRLALDDE